MWRPNDRRSAADAHAVDTGIPQHSGTVARTGIAAGGSALVASGIELPASFRKLSAVERRRLLVERFGLEPQELDATAGSSELLELAQIMVESAVGVMPVPLGLAHGFLIDDVVRSVPLAVEEPSVVAAAGYAAAIIRRGGGFFTSATDPIMTCQIALTNCRSDAEQQITAREQQICRRIDPLLAGMQRRGGGFRGMDVTRLARTGLVVVRIHIDVRDAMGANILNSVAENCAEFICNELGCNRLMAILTNAAERRIARAEFALPAARLGRGGLSGSEIAERIVLATRFADEDGQRAVTHNKGIMNGITSLALATANDTRGIEAAVHAWAARDGSYRSLTHYELNAGVLTGSIEAPLPFGVVGGAVGFHPASRFALKLLGNPDAVTLSRIAAAVGLAQNFAALHALVGEGIQSGHMRLHSTRLAWSAGARGAEVAGVAERIARTRCFNAEGAAEALRSIRSGQ
ncbi:MAG: hydroxymethylglutaryl-CoA reductase, degradative [Spirochaetaceae bacterium]|nr:MAG: hydroxymethylglutaryl-CoA reductase, degradative [Spirochaetaceae bacterium]